MSVQAAFPTFIEKSHVYRTCVAGGVCACARGRALPFTKLAWRALVRSENEADVCGRYVRYNFKDVRQQAEETDRSTIRTRTRSCACSEM